MMIKIIKSIIFACSLVVQLQYTQKETSWSWQSSLSIMYQTLPNGGTCEKGFLASSHTTSSDQSGEQPTSHKDSHTVAAVFKYKRTISVTGIRL